VLRVVAFLSRAGFKCAFDVPVEIDGQAKVPDLSVAKGDVSAVVEVTRLCFPLRVEEEFERLEAEALEAIRAGRPARSVRGQPVEASSSIRIGRSIRKKRGRAGRAGQVPRNALGVVVVDADDGGLSLAEPWPEIERAIVEAMKDAPTLAACIFRRAHIAPRHIADETRTVTRISSSAILVQRCLRSGELEELFLAANEACTLDGCARLLDELRQAIEG
jgi:hypothetical protein